MANRGHHQAILAHLETAAKARARELQAMLPSGASGRITMAIGIARDASGQLVTLVGTSEPNGYLRSGVVLHDDEVLAPGTGHAEADIVDNATSHDVTLLTVAAGDRSAQLASML